MADEFLRSGKDVVIYDSLYHGLESRIDYLRNRHGRLIQFINADIRDSTAFSDALLEFKPIGIVHSAALKSVEESIKNPSEYMEVNFQATRSILAIAEAHNIKNCIFSSTAAVYGSPAHSRPVKEDDPTFPISPYGESKLLAEFEVEKFRSTSGNKGISLRFFNVVGTAAPQLKDNAVDNLVPIVLRRLQAGLTPVIFGTDYPTPDGTCIRDYVDVRDVARAHFMVSESKNVIPKALNVGTGNGASVREVIDMLSKTLPKNHFRVIETGRRVGDPAVLYADVSQLKKVMDFVTSYNLHQSILTVI